MVVGLPGIWLPLSPGIQLLAAPGPARHPDPFPGTASPQGTAPARFLGCPGQGGGGAGGQNTLSHGRGKPCKNRVPGGRTRAVWGRAVVNNSK